MVILDVHLPGGEHGDMAIPIMRERLGESVALVVVSGYSQVALQQRCLLLGADIYLEKPVSVVTMRHLWQCWLVKNRTVSPRDPNARPSIVTIVASP